MSKIVNCSQNKYDRTHSSGGARPAALRGGAGCRPRPRRRRGAQRGRCRCARAQLGVGAHVGCVAAAQECLGRLCSQGIPLTGALRFSTATFRLVRLRRACDPRAIERTKICAARVGRGRARMPSARSTTRPTCARWRVACRAMMRRVIQAASKFSSLISRARVPSQGGTPSLEPWQAPPTLTHTPSPPPSSVKSVSRAARGLLASNRGAVQQRERERGRASG